MAKAKKKRTSKKPVKASKRAKSTKAVRATKTVKVVKAIKGVRRTKSSRSVTPEAFAARKTSQPEGQSDRLGSMVGEQEPQPAYIRTAMDQAWRDKHHVRNQTWKAAQLVFALAAGLIAVDVVLCNMAATVMAGVLVVAASVAGIGIALYHRDVEIKKLSHILNCEKALGLLRSDLIGEVEQPRRVTFRDVFTCSGSNTTLFFLRMYAAVLLLAVVFVVVRCCVGF